ncbi:MAG TPA: sugar transferase [Acidimicrobiales bacterium]|jgi:lipopolysaccharide/colanic/teichoic acid biosynthesis glycosyltransferase|nr:sugar transferase [Acidimicrobiales bacterium]
MNRTAAGALALLLSPVLAVVALVVRMADGRPLFFVHQRAGLDGRPFGLLKFRTMRPPVSPGETDADRITGVGRLLRRSSLDELPELWNVVRGDMNLVGPRPLPVAYSAEYSPTEARRLEVKPGLTGLVQVRGRNALTWDEKFALDTWYVEHRTRALDLRILLQTPLVVLYGRGISHGGHATMPEFKGQKG